MGDNFDKSGRQTFEGPVGIGVSQPNSKLHVSGEIKAEKIYVTDTVTATSFIGNGAALTNIQLEIDTVKTEQITNYSITTLKIKDGAITRDKLDSSISLEIPNGGVGTQELADNAVTTSKIADGTITRDKIEDGTITQDKLDPSISFDKKMLK